MSYETMERIIKFIKSANIKFDTPLTVKSNNNVRDAL
jgi:hypothetical protein